MNVATTIETNSRSAQISINSNFEITNKEDYFVTSTQSRSDVIIVSARAVQNQDSNQGFVNSIAQTIENLKRGLRAETIIEFTDEPTQISEGELYWLNISTFNHAY